MNDLQDQIEGLKRMLKLLETSCQEEEANLDKLDQKKIRLRRLVKQFKDNDEEYLKIKNTVIQQVTSLLFDVKGLLRLSLDSLMESMRTDPQKYSKLIYYNARSSTKIIEQHFIGYSHIPRQQLYPSYNDFFEEYNSTLLDNAEKLYSKSVKEWTEQIIKEYSIKNNSSMFFRLDKERRQHKPFMRSLPISLSNDQTHPFKRIDRIFVRTEFD